MHLLGRRLALVVILVLGSLGASSATFAQTDPAPEDTAVDAPATAALTAPQASTTEPTTPRTTTTLAPCEKTAEPAITFVGKPVIRADTVISFEVDRVITGKLETGKADVNFPLDDRFLYDGRTYRVTASYDAEAKVFVSKIRPPRYLAAHCLAKDKIYTTHEDGSVIDTGIFSGMTGNWKFVPLDFIYPLLGGIALLVVLVLIKRGLVVLLRDYFRRRARSAEGRSAEL